MIKVERTTFRVDGIDEPCIIVSNDFAKVRLSKCYHYIGADSLYLYEYLDGEYNSSEEWEGDYDLLTDADAVRLAKKFCVYF